MSYAVGHDWDHATAHVPGPAHALINQWLDTGAGTTYWVQATTAPTTAAGQPVTVNDTPPTTEQWNLAAVEVTPPTVSIINPTPGQLVSGQISVATNASGNVAVATDPSSNTGTSATVTVTVQNPGPPMTCFVLQVQTSVQGRGTVKTAAVKTTMAGELLPAFVSTDGPKGAGRQTATVSGAGLTWKLVARTNGEAEM